MLRRTEEREGSRAYPRTIVWSGEYHSVPVTIRILVLARRRFEWTLETQGVRPLQPRREMLENTETSEHAVLRRALSRVELANRWVLLRPAWLIGRKPPSESALSIHERMQLLREARAQARRERIAQVQPDLPGIE